MQNLPFEKNHIKDGTHLFEENKIGQILFSSGTYQIEVFDPSYKEPLWPFIQLDEKGKLSDCFCSCADEELTHSCPHLVCAFLAIFRDKNTPLNVRFQNSLWNRCAQIAALRHGYETDLLKKEANTYHAYSETGKDLFSIKSLSKEGSERLKEFIDNRLVETEETSLKFSNLPIEEIVLWKAGRPSHFLKYELSFWSDLAKWWMVMQDRGEKYEITFSHQDTKGLPKWMNVKFTHVEFRFYMTEANWPQIIPSLASVESPLHVYELPEELVKKITYDPIEKRLQILTTPLLGKKEGVDMGEWFFVPNNGFYPKEADSLLTLKEIPEKKIPLFFHRLYPLLEKYLKGTKWHQELVTPKYKLFFDKSGDFHIKTYVFEEGDLEKPLSAFFSPWVYLEGKGFYQLEKPYFDSVDKRIPKTEMSEFVNRHRLWLQSFEGFQTHVSGIESHLSYHVNEEGSLYFESRIEESEEIGELIDLGEWIYIYERGFYAKKSLRTGSQLKPGVIIPKERVSSFIHSHKEELEQVKEFFSSDSFLEKLGLSIFLNKDERIIVRPEYYFHPPYTPETVQVFDQFLYVENEGFSEVSPQFVIPKEYTKEKMISPYEEAYFVSYELDQLMPYVISLDPRLIKPQKICLSAKEVRKEEKKEVRGWLANLKYETEKGSVDAFEVWQAYTEKRPYIFTEAGLFFLKAQRFTWLKNVTKKRWVKNGAELRLSAMEWLHLFAFEDVKEPIGKETKDAQTRKILEELHSFQTEEVIDLKGLKSHLRPYQELGLRWLWFIYTESLSGLLCDEMGLGKTHQAMALLAAASNASSEKSVKYLVVCPTSVIYHWQDLLKQFLPHLRICIFYGALRTLETFENEYDLLLTSYGTLRSEKRTLSKIHFEIAIFDELQIAKNASSQIHKALASMDTHVRIGLTGTPIENQILELKALFDLIIPNYFPSEAVFKEIFVNPIEKYQDKEKKEFLSRLVKPFMLRRKKRDVLKELPEKIEEISSCPMSDEQRALYTQIYQTHKEAIVQEIGGGVPSLSITHIFSLISKLKQLCDHPALVYKTPSEYKKHSSGKWDLFVELLDEAKQSGQKCVVFSQYLEMLDIIELHLKENNIVFAGIRGSTQNRHAQLEMFKNDPQCQVFVASLQAAGVGIDLTSASVVIHYDRWWNPAKENQATDRVHRIGQSRGVQVFKLVTKGSIEEHIHNLIEKKIHLMESVIGFDEHDQLKSLNRKELVELLQMLQKDVE